MIGQFVVVMRSRVLRDSKIRFSVLLAGQKMSKNYESVY
jgi:hypothetical protein